VRVDVLPLNANDQDWVERFITEHWGASKVVVHGTVYYSHLLPGFVAVQDEARVGLVTFHVEQNSFGIVSLDSLQPGRGIGPALIEAVKQAARQRGCKRVWLVTTNDNLNALRFYQRRRPAPAQPKVLAGT
jgi:GNAT superfamily N-acetyltransferase